MISFMKRGKFRRGGPGSDSNFPQLAATEENYISSFKKPSEFLEKNGNCSNVVPDLSIYNLL